MALSRSELTALYRKRAKRYDRTANLYYLIGFREWAYRKKAVAALPLAGGFSGAGCPTRNDFMASLQHRPCARAEGQNGAMEGDFWGLLEPAPFVFGVYSPENRRVFFSSMHRIFARRGTRREASRNPLMEMDFLPRLNWHGPCRAMVEEVMEK